MNTHAVESLYNLSLDSLCDSMTEEVLVHTLNVYPPLQVLQIIWKILHVADENQWFNTHGTPIIASMTYTVQRVQNISQTTDLLYLDNYPYFKPETLELLGRNHQIKFIDKYNFCHHFGLKLFFEVVGFTELRHQLFVIFQICVQVKGFKFPEEFAKSWIQSEKQVNIDENICFHYIEQGLKLGIFLGDSGWFNESALVLSHTYNIITTKWVCHDQNLKLTKIIQCLTKWLLVTSNYLNFVEAKVVLQHMLNTISILENMEGRTLCIAYAYVSVSQYYHVFMDYNEAWAWAVKAVNEFHDESDDVLKLLVVSHTIRVCTVLNKLKTAKDLIDQLHMYNKKIDEYIHIDILLNEACYSLKADVAMDSIFNYLIALDFKRNVFGFYNLHTAIVFVDYAYARYVSTNFSEALRSILQGIFIMEKIGLPSDNLLLVNAGRIKALILEEVALGIGIRLSNLNSVDLPDTQYLRSAKEMYQKLKKGILHDAEILHLKALEVSLKAVGEKSLLTAKSYCNLGRLYQSQEKYEQSEQMHLKAIEIKVSILGKDNPEVKLSLSHLASLYRVELEKYHEAEQLHLQSKNMSNGLQLTGLLNDLQGLTQVYRKLN